MESLKHKNQTVSAIKWNTLNQVIIQGINFGMGILMMRLLSPKEFGLIGMVTIFSGFVAVLGNFGLGASLIQKKEINQLDKSSLFFVNLILGFLLTAILFLSSNFIAMFYNQPELSNIAKFISFTFLINSISVIPLSLLKRNLRYKEIFLLNLFVNLISGTIGVALALNDFGVYSLVLKQLSAIILMAIIVWFAILWRPSLNFSLDILKVHLRFGLPVFGTSFFSYWVRNSDNLLIGKFISSEALGIYSKAYGLMMLPITQITQVISSVLLPSFSLIQDDPFRIKVIYLKISRFIAFLTFPLMGLVFVLSESIVDNILGSKWSSITPILEIFSLVGALSSISSLNGNIYLSLGRTKLMFYVTLFGSLLTVSAFVFAVKFGIYFMAWAFFATVLVKFIPNTYIMGRLINLSFLEFIKNLLTPIVVSIVLSLGFNFLITNNNIGVGFFYMVSFAILYFVCYLFIILIFDRPLYNEVIRVLKYDLLKRAA